MYIRGISSPGAVALTGSSLIPTAWIVPESGVSSFGPIHASSQWDVIFKMALQSIIRTPNATFHGLARILEFCLRAIRHEAVCSEGKSRVQ